MKTIQMTLDEDLVKAVDRVSKQLNTTRSAFTRKALREALVCHNLEKLERKHRAALLSLGRKLFGIARVEINVEVVAVRTQKGKSAFLLRRALCEQRVNSVGILRLVVAVQR